MPMITWPRRKPPKERLTLTRKSSYAIAWKTDSHTDYLWRVVKKGDALNATAASNVIKLIVK